MPLTTPQGGALKRRHRALGSGVVRETLTSKGVSQQGSGDTADNLRLGHVSGRKRMLPKSGS
eukprot:4827616-Heterocapsa_arctica.AAC.1